MRIIGADPSLTAFGIATPEGPLTLHPPKDARGPARLRWLRNAFRVQVRGDQRADLVVIEGFSYNSQGSSIYEIAGLGWILRLDLHEGGIPYVEVSPSQLKLYATGRGVAQKEDVLANAIRRLGYEGSDHNQSDALWLREMAVDRYSDKRPSRVPADRFKVLTKITWPDLKVPA